MKNYLAGIIFSLFLTHSTFSQVPSILWQNTIGSDGYDYCESIKQFSDGSYMIAGSADGEAFGDKSEFGNGSNDYWIVKLTQTGDIEWQNSIGGSGVDMLRDFELTADGGMILAGYSGSGIGGDKTESFIPNNTGGFTYDYWVVKLNSIGNIEWQNTIGGKAEDRLTCIDKTDDGGYIIGGYSKSNISGDKTEANIGGLSYWILKLNSTGDIVWQNTIDGINDDYLTDIHQTTDGGYIVGGHSKSGISGEKTEACFSDSYDYWILKLNSTGNIVWQNTIGGNNDESLKSIMETPDGGFIIGGSSLSNATGDKTENQFDMGDFWIVKLNSSGSIVWQNNIGGNGGESSPLVEPAPGGGYYVCGSSGTDLSPDKSVPQEGNNDYWLLKLDESGNILWQDVFGGIGYETFRTFHQTLDGGLIIGGGSGSGISGDKTEIAIDPLGGSNEDYWIIKLEGDTCISSTEVCNGIDDNCNGTIDDGVINTASIIATDVTTFCEGGSVPLYVTYTGNSTLQWKRNGNNIAGANMAVYIASASGTYTCRVTNACGSVLSTGIPVIRKKNPAASVTAGGPVVFCMGGSVILTANSGAGLSYQWLKNAVNIVGATSINYTATTAGNYTCLVTKNATGCNKLSNPVTVTINCKEDASINTDPSIFIFPNPSSDKITITLSSSILITPYSPLTITDISGKTIAQYQLTSPETEIDISNYPSGIYFVKMIIDNKQLTEKFIKQ